MSKSVRGVLKINNFLLLIKRIKNKNIYYVFPGGHMEGDESDRKTCIREFKEETNLDILPVKHLGVIREGYSFTTSYYICKLKSDREGKGLPKVRMIGPEIKKDELDNYYKPLWININDLRKKTIYPVSIVKMIINDEL